MKRNEKAQQSEINPPSQENNVESGVNNPVSVDLLAPKTPHPYQHKWRLLIMSGLGLIIIAIIGFGSYAYSLTKNQITEKPNQKSFFGQLRRIIDTDTEQLLSESDGRINVLLLGKGGPNHPGGTLTDTIIVASLLPATKEVALLSLPRDLVVAYKNNNSLYEEYRKLNYAMEIGGIELAKEKITEITGLPIHYYVVADFSGFRNIIDDVGGLDIYVEKSFSDFEYPDYNYGYQTITFKEGWNHFDGERALQYARSRHGNNGEGSDFRRAKRQQKILEAAKDKLLSMSTLLNPSKITKILNDVGSHVSTNAEIWEIMRFADLALEVDKEAIINKVVDNTQNGLLVSEIAPETGAYILIPRLGLGKYGEIQKLAKNIFALSGVTKEHPSAAIQNGSGISGAAGDLSEKLEENEISITSTQNAKSVDVKKTIIYDLTKGSKPESKEALRQILPATFLTATFGKNSTVRLSTDLDPNKLNLSVISDDVDFVILLGQDFPELLKKQNKKSSKNNNSL